jgi:3-methyladenine DNA glycosylase AlkC
MATQQTPRLMKDGLDAKAIDRLAVALLAADPSFDQATFKRRAKRGLEQLELKARVQHVIAALGVVLPADFRKALPVVVAASAKLPAAAADDSLGGFALWPLVDWVPVHGLEHFDVSLAALRRLTSRFSAEFAIRPFLLADPPRAMATLATWLDDPSEHVRRLVSEGTRPRLPWGQQLPMFRADPTPVLALLVRLRDDPSEYVRRSVANNLNDMAKDHPALVISTAAAWWDGASPERQALVRHALRSLVKQGEAGALQVLGFATSPKVDVTLNLARQAVAIGESLAFELTVVSTARRTQKLVIDYVVHHQRAGGKLTTKVFKWRNLDLPAGASVTLAKAHAFVPRSVRRLYPGPHRLEVLVGGQVLGGHDFVLRDVI